MGRVLDFEYYEKDKLCTRVHVDYKKQTVDVENFTDDIVSQAFGRTKATIDLIDDFFRDRVFEETRPDLDFLLSSIDLKFFDAEDIARYTHGMLYDDDYWVNFLDNPITYEEIAKLRNWS